MTDYATYRALPAQERDELGFARWKELQRIGTHGTGCHAWGPRHYGCAVRENAALLDRIADLEAQLESIGAGGVHGPLIGCASPPTAQAEGWTKPHRTITYTCPVCAASLERQE